MSEPKRYERCYHKDYIPEGMEEHYNGKWVSYADYARLKAEVERMKGIIFAQSSEFVRNAAKEGKPSV